MADPLNPENRDQFPEVEGTFQKTEPVNLSPQGLAALPSLLSPEELESPEKIAVPDIDVNLSPVSPEVPDLDFESKLSAFASEPSPQLPVAQELINLRDDPDSIDLFGGLASRISKGQLPFNKQAWTDSKANVQSYLNQTAPDLAKAQISGDWGTAVKIGVTGVGKTLGAFLQTGFGATNEQLEKAQRSLGARNFIGTIDDPEMAAKAIELGDSYENDVRQGKSIVPEGQAPSMAFGTGPLQVKLGMNLAMAEGYLKDLQSDRNKKLGTAGLRNFAIQSGDAFLPFVGIGDIVIDDEKDPDQVARRRALTNAINDVVYKDYGVSTLAGAAAGSVGSFVTVGGLATKALGNASKIAGASVKQPNILSRGTTYAVIGASQSFEGDPRNLSVGQRLASVFSEAAVLSLAEGAGNKLENAIDNSLANYVAAKAISANIPAFVPVLGSMGRVVGTTVGETASEELEAILRGQDPVEPFLQNLGVSFGVGVGMAGISGVPLAARAAKIRREADKRIGVAIEDAVKSVLADKKLTDDQKETELNKIRNDLKAERFKNIFDAARIKAPIDPALNPETAKVAQENLDRATEGAAQDVLTKALSREEEPAPSELAPGQLAQPIAIGEQPVEITRPPETQEEIDAAFNELANEFRKGADNITLPINPQNQAKIQWLEGQGKIFGKREGDNYVIYGVKTVDEAGNEDWLGEKDPEEIMDELTESIRVRAKEAKDLDQDERDALEAELEAAKRTQKDDKFLIERMQEIAEKYLGPDEGAVAIENDLLNRQEKIDVEQAAQLRVNRIQAAIASLQKQIPQLPPEEAAPLQESLARFEAELAKESSERVDRGEQAVVEEVRSIEREMDSGNISPIVLETGERFLAINNPEGNQRKELNRLSPDPRENNKEALGQVFDLENENVVRHLQSLGAIDENNRPLMTPADVLEAYLKRKESYLKSKSLSGYQAMNIADEVTSGTKLNFLLELRRGKNKIALSTIFNSRLREFIRAAKPRMAAGIGVGAARRFEAQSPGRVDFEALAEAQGLNPNSAQVVEELMAEVGVTESDFQANQKSPVNIPSISERYEALAIIAQQEADAFRNSLPSDLEKLAFDSIRSEINVAQEAAKIKKTVADVNGVVESVKDRFRQTVLEKYRQAQAQDNLPQLPVVEEELVRAGDLTDAQMKPVLAKLEKFEEDFVFDPAELEEVQALREKMQQNRRAQDLKKFDDRMTEILVTKLDEAQLDQLSSTIFANLQNIQDSERLSQKKVDDFAAKFAKLEEAYNNALEIENPADPTRLKQLAAFRAALLALNKNLLLDAGLIETEEGIVDKKKGIDEKAPEKTKAKEPAKEPAPSKERKTAREQFAEILSGKPAGKPAAAERKGVGERAPERPAVTGRGPGASRDGQAKPIPANFAVPREQQTLKYDESSISVLGEKILSWLTPEQRQDVAAAIASMEGSAFGSFYLANGPGTGKTSVLLSVAKYYLDRGFDVIYLTESEAVTPNWSAGTIGGSIQRDAESLGIPLSVRGSKEGLPIERVEGRVLVSTYETNYLEQIKKIVNKKTVVLMDEQHAGRNLFEKEVEGKQNSEAVLMSEIADAAGKVLMASGTPIDRFDQLHSLKRLGIFAAETIEQLGKRLGFVKTYNSLSGKKTKKARWIPAIDVQQASRNLQNFLEKLTGDGKIRSRSLKLDGVDVRFKDVPLNETVIKQLDDVKKSYGGDQNRNLSSRRSVIGAQKRILEEFKVQAAVAQALDAIRRGRKPVIYVGYVSDEDSSGESVNPTAKAVEEALLAINKDFKIAKMYSDSGQEKSEALNLFNNEDADVLIATKEMGGTGIELDDKYGNSPREMIIMSIPTSGVQATQLIYRVRRINSASYPTIVFLGSEAEADRVSMASLVDRLTFLDAFLGVGLDKLEQQAQKVNEKTKVLETEEPSAEEIATAESFLNKIFGKDYSNGVFTVRDEKGKPRQYAVAFSKEITAAMAQPGDTNETDTITFNPAWLINIRNSAKTEKEFLSYLTRVSMEETVHVETFRYFRDQGQDPAEELTAIAEALGERKRLAHARLYFSSKYKADITSPEAQAEIIALANNPVVIAAEAIRQMVDLNLAGGVIEESILEATEEDRKRAAALAKELGLTGSKNLLKRFSLWFNGMSTAMKRGLGLAPNALDRLAIKPSIESAIIRIQKLGNEFSKAAELAGQAMATPAASSLSPSRPRAATVMDGYDLRIYRMIENHLEGLTEGVLGVSAAPDEFRTVDAADWIAALGTAHRRGLITRYERNLFRAAARPYLNRGRVSLALIANESLRIAEEQSIAGTPPPTESLVPISSPQAFEITDAELGTPMSQPAAYRVKIGNSPAINTTAVSSTKAVSNAIYRGFQNQEVITFNGQNYSRGGMGKLIDDAKKFGVDRLATRIDSVGTPPGGVPATRAIPTFEEFVSEKSNLSIPEKPVRETFRDDFGEINVTKAWEQVKETRPSVVKVPRGYLESYLPYIKTEKRLVEKADPKQPGLAEFIRNPERPEYVGIRVVDGWHRAQKALDENVDFYVYPVVSEKSTMRNAYDFAVNFDGFYPKAVPAAEPIQTNVSLTAEGVTIPVAIQTPPLPTPTSRLSPSKAIANITAKYKDSIRDDANKETLFNAWQRMSVPQEQQFAWAREYIESHRQGFSGALGDFLSGNIDSTLPVQAALGFELLRVLGPRAKTDKYYESKMVEVMLKLSRKYGTEAGQAVQLWSALGEMSDNPEAMKVFINRQLDSIRGNLYAYGDEEAEVGVALRDANRRAAESMATDSKTQSTLDKIAKLVELKKKKATFAEVEAAVRGYIVSEEAQNAARQFIGEDIGAGTPDPMSTDGENIRLDPVQTKALSTLILQIIQRSENPKVTAASPEEIMRLILLIPEIRDSKNQANIQRKLGLYFNASLAVALETIEAEALGEARAREQESMPASFGEGQRRATKAKQRAAERAPVVIQGGQASEIVAYGEAFADRLQLRAEKLQEEPEKKEALEIFIDKLRRDIAAKIREEGGLQPAYEPEPSPTEAQTMRDRVANLPQVLLFLNSTRDALSNYFTPEQIVGLEPIFDEVLDLPITTSNLKRTISSLESIGGPRTNVRSLIRSSKGDIEAFENKMLALLTENTNLDQAERQTVMGYLRDTMTKLIAQERKKALQTIKDRFERRKERKTRKVRTVLDRLIEATNLGVLRDSDIFLEMHSQLGLPELGVKERERLNQLIDELPKYPVGRIRNKKISEMYQYVKLVAPQIWGDLIVNYQTANVLAGAGTIGINAWSAFVSNQLNAALLASVASVKKLLGIKSAEASIEGTKAFYSALLGKDKIAVKAALDTLLRGNYGNSVDALTQELGGVNIWEAILDQGEAFRYGKPGAIKPELPIRAFGQEFRIPLDSKFISSKYGILAPFIWFGRAMAAGDAFNRVSAKKLYEMAEATNLAIAKGLTSPEEIETEVRRLLNLTPEARRRAEARARDDARQFGFENDPVQIQLRIEEILEQSRPDSEEVQDMVKKAQEFAARSAFMGDYEGLFGLIAESLTTFSNRFWPARLIIKFLRTGSNLANEVLNFMPVISTIRLYRGTGNFFGALKGTKYYKAPPVPGSVEHDLLVGKMSLGLIITAGLLALLKEAIDGEDDPAFMIHVRGPNDPAQRESLFAAQVPLRSIQYGRFRDGRPKFISFESLPVGLTGPLLLVGSIVETIRYDKRSKAEAYIAGAMMGGLIASYGVLDMAALSGIRQIMSLTSPGPGQRDPKSLMTNLTKVAGNVAASLIPGYATLRDIEQVFNGLSGAPSARAYQTNLLSTFAQAVPFASKVGQPDLDHLGGNVKTQLLNSTPFLRRIFKFGVDAAPYNEGSRTPDAIHSKLISLFATNRFSLDWDAGPLKDFAMLELIVKAEKEGAPLTADDFFELSRELTPEEKYEWLRRSGPVIQDALAPLIPQLETMSRNEFMLVVRSLVNPIKRGILYQILSEKNQQDILLRKAE